MGKKIAMKKKNITKISDVQIYIIKC